MAFIKRIRLTVVVCLLVFATTTITADSSDSQFLVARALTETRLLSSTYTVPAKQSESEVINDEDDKRVDPNDGSTRPSTKTNGIDAATATSTNFITERALRMNLLFSRKKPQKKPIHAAKPAKTKPRSEACTESKRKSKNGKNRNFECQSYEYTEFAQVWKPAAMFAAKKCRDCASPEEARDWSNNLKIRGLSPVHSKLRRVTTRMTPQAKAAVKKNDWPHVNPRTDTVEYEWKKHGSISGFTALEYVKEINRLHALHPTPMSIKLPEEGMIPLTKLKTAFGAEACLMCKFSQKQQYFLEARFCHQVDIKSHHARAMVTYSRCGVCDSKAVCNQKSILIKHITQRLE